MATFTMKFFTDNAWGEDQAQRDLEIARILYAIANHVEHMGCPPYPATIADFNGNPVGRWALKSMRRLKR